MPEGNTDVRTFDELVKDITERNVHLSDIIGGLGAMIDRIEGSEPKDAQASQGEGGQPNHLSAIRNQVDRFYSLNHELEHQLNRLNRHF